MQQSSRNNMKNTINNLPEKVIVYARCSSRNKNNLIEQVNACIEHCSSKGYDIETIHLSKANSSDGYKQLKQVVKLFNNNLVLVVTSVDRVTRSLADLTELNTLFKRVEVAYRRQTFFFKHLNLYVKYYSPSNIRRLKQETYAKDVDVLE